MASHGCIPDAAVLVSDVDRLKPPEEWRVSERRGRPRTRSGVAAAHGVEDQFGKFAAVRHLISGREDPIADIDWSDTSRAGYADETCFSFTGRSRSIDRTQYPDQALSRITGALAVGVFGVALAPSFLRPSAQFSRSEYRNSPASRLAWRYQQKYQQSGRLQWAFACIFNRS